MASNDTSMIDPALQTLSRGASHMSSPPPLSNAPSPAPSTGAAPIPTPDAEPEASPARATGKKARKKPSAPAGSAAEFRRKEANRLAAERSRMRASEKAKGLEHAVELVTAENERLEAQIRELEQAQGRNGSSTGDTDGPMRGAGESGRHEGDGLTGPEGRGDSGEEVPGAGADTGLPLDAEAEQDAQSRNILAALMSGGIPGLEGFAEADDPTRSTWPDTENTEQATHANAPVGEQINGEAVIPRNGHGPSASGSGVADTRLPSPLIQTASSLPTTHEPATTVDAHLNHSNGNEFTANTLSGVGPSVGPGSSSSKGNSASHGTGTPGGGGGGSGGGILAKAKVDYTYDPASALTSVCSSVAVLLNAEMEKSLRDDVAASRASIAELEREVGRLIAEIHRYDSLHENGQGVEDENGADGLDGGDERQDGGAGSEDGGGRMGREQQEGATRHSHRGDGPNGSAGPNSDPSGGLHSMSSQAPAPAPLPPTTFSPLPSIRTSLSALSSDLATLQARLPRAHEDVSLFRTLKVAEEAKLSPVVRAYLRADKASLGLGAGDDGPEDGGSAHAQADAEDAAAASTAAASSGAGTRGARMSGRARAESRDERYKEEKKHHVANVRSNLRGLGGYLGLLVWGARDIATAIPVDHTTYSTPAIARRRRGRPPKAANQQKQSHSMLYPSHAHAHAQASATASTLAGASSVSVSSPARQRQRQSSASAAAGAGSGALTPGAGPAVVKAPRGKKGGGGAVRAAAAVSSNVPEGAPGADGQHQDRDQEQEQEQEQDQDGGDDHDAQAQAQAIVKHLRATLAQGQTAGEPVEGEAHLDDAAPRRAHEAADALAASAGSATNGPSGAEGSDPHNGAAVAAVEDEVVFDQLKRSGEAFASLLRAQMLQGGHSSAAEKENGAGGMMASQDPGRRDLDSDIAQQGSAVPSGDRAPADAAIDEYGRPVSGDAGDQGDDVSDDEEDGDEMEGEGEGEGTAGRAAAVPANANDPLEPAVLEQLRKGPPGSCEICGRVASSVWRKLTIGGEDYRVCNACGLYHKKFGVIRPATLWGDGASVRKRRPARGPDEDRRRVKRSKQHMADDEHGSGPLASHYAAGPGNNMSSLSLQGHVEREYAIQAGHLQGHGQGHVLPQGEEVEWEDYGHGDGENKEEVEGEGEGDRAGHGEEGGGGGGGLADAAVGQEGDEAHGAAAADAEGRRRVDSYGVEPEHGAPSGQLGTATVPTAAGSISIDVKPSRTRTRTSHLPHARAPVRTDHTGELLSAVQTAANVVDSVGIAEFDPSAEVDITALPLPVEGRENAEVRIRGHYAPASDPRHQLPAVSSGARGGTEGDQEAGSGEGNDGGDGDEQSQAQAQAQAQAQGQGASMPVAQYDLQHHRFDPQHHYIREAQQAVHAAAAAAAQAQAHYEAEQNRMHTHSYPHTHADTQTNAQAQAQAEADALAQVHAAAQAQAEAQAQLYAQAQQYFESGQFDPHHFDQPHHQQQHQQQQQQQQQQSYGQLDFGPHDPHGQYQPHDQSHDPQQGSQQQQQHIPLSMAMQMHMQQLQAEAQGQGAMGMHPDMQMDMNLEGMDMQGLQGMQGMEGMHGMHGPDQMGVPMDIAMPDGMDLDNLDVGDVEVPPELLEVFGHLQ